MSSNPIEFDVTFGNLQGAVAQWQAYQGALEGVITESAQLGTSQQNMSRTMQAQQQAAAQAGDALANYATAVTNAASAHANFDQATQQSISILSGAGTAAQGAATNIDTLGSSATSAGGALQNYSQEVVDAANAHANFEQSAQQSVSILDGAGTSADNAASRMQNFSGAMSNVGNELNKSQGDLNQAGILIENLGGQSETTFQKVQSLGQSFGMAAGSITGLVFSAHALNRAQFTLNLTETRLEAARNKLADQTSKLSKATLQYGADSQEVAAILDDMAIQQERISNFEERAQLVQESYNHTLVAFATTTGPLVISTISSVTQGITSMGEVLKVSRQDVMSFIGAWGGWIAAGAAIVAVAVDVISVLNKVNGLMKEREGAVAAGDPFAKLNAELKILQTYNTDPLFKIGSAIQNIFGGPEGQKAQKEFTLELQLREWQSQVVKETDAFVKSPEIANAFASLPPKLSSTLQGSLDSIVKIPFNPTNYLNAQGEVDPKLMEDSLKLFREKFLKGFADKIAAMQKEQLRVTLTGTETERANLLGLPTQAQMEQERQIYEGNLTSALVLIKNFNTARLADNKLTWDRYIAQTDLALTESGQKFADFAKQFVNLQSNFSGTGAQGSRQFFETLQGGFQEVDDAEKAMLPTTKNVDLALGVMNDTMKAVGVTGNETAQGIEAATKAVAEMIKEHDQAVLVQKTLHDQMAETVTQWAGPLPQGIEFTTEELTAANDKFKETGSVTAALNVLLAKNRAEFDQLRESLGDVDQQITDVINATDLLTGTQDRANESLAKWFDNMVKNQAQEKAEHERLVEMATDFGIKVPDGINITNEALKKGIEVWNQTHDANKALDVIMADYIAKMKEVSKLTLDVVNETNELADRFGGAASFADQASTAFADWFLKLNQSIGVSDELNKILLEQATSFGINLPAGIKLTNEQLQALIESYKRTGTEAGAMAQIHNEAFSEMHGLITDVVSAAVEGGKDWKEAWKGMQDAIPKGQKGFFKDFFGDLADFQEAETTLNQTSAALDAFLDVTGGQMDTEMIDDFSKKFVKDIKDLRDQANDLPFVNGQLDSLLKQAQDFAATADNAEDFRVLNTFVKELNEKMKDGLTADEIKDLTTKWGALFDSWASGAKVDFNAITGGIDSISASFDTMLGKVDKIETNPAGNLAFLTTDPFNVKKVNPKDVPTVDVTAQITAIDPSTLPAGSNAVDVSGKVTALMDALGTTRFVDVVGRVTSLDTKQVDQGGPLHPISFESDGAIPESEESGKIVVDGKEMTQEEFERKKREQENPPAATPMVLPAPDTSQFLAGLKEAATMADTFTTLFNKQVLIMPAPTTDEFLAGIEQAATIGDAFIALFNAAFGGGGGGKKKKGASGLIIGAPDTTQYLAGFELAATIGDAFIELFNSTFGGGGGKKKKKGASGLIIGAPDTTQYLAGFEEAAAIGDAFIALFNAAFGGGGGGKKKKKGGGLVIGAPNIDQYLAGVEEAAAIADAFIELFNNAMGGGGSGKKKKKGGGLVIGAPSIDEFQSGLEAATSMTDDFVSTFSDGMDEMDSAASSAAGDIQSSFEDIQSSAEDAQSAVDDLQSSIDNLQGKTIEVKVNISGAGVKYLAEGFHGVVNKPTILVVGEAGPERVDVQPSFQAPTPLANRMLNINPVFTQSATDMKKKLGTSLKDLLSEGTNMPNAAAIVQSVIKHITIPVKVNINRKTLLEIVQEHLLEI